MQTMKNIVVLSTLAVVAMAQAKPTPKSPVSAPASQTVAKPTPAKAAPVKPIPLPAKQAAVPARIAPMKTAAAPAKPSMKPAPKARTASAQKMVPAAKKPAASTIARSKRDPFVSPVRAQGGGPGGQAACTTGPKCLIVQQVVLKGVVKTTSGMIAMVENAAKKQYNLREKDPVYNGFVLKITGDSIVFRESVTDMLGNATTKEVVKRVTVPVV